MNVRFQFSVQAVEPPGGIVRLREDGRELARNRMRRVEGTVAPHWLPAGVYWPLFVCVVFSSKLAWM